MNSKVVVIVAIFDQVYVDFFAAAILLLGGALGSYGELVVWYSEVFRHINDWNLCFEYILYGCGQRIYHVYVLHLIIT